MANLSDVYTPPGQEIAPCSIELMWQDYGKMLRTDGVADDVIEQRKDAFYYAVQHLLDELIHFTGKDPKVDKIVRDYYREAMDVVMSGHANRVYVPSAKSLAAN